MYKKWNYESKGINASLTGAIILQGIKELFTQKIKKISSEDVFLMHQRNISSAKKFLRKAIKAHGCMPYRINTDNHAPLRSAIDDLKEEGVIDSNAQHSRVKFLNNIIESDHGRVKRRIRPMLGFKSFTSASRCIKCIETMIMFAKNQSFWITNILKNQITFINKLFHLHPMGFSI